MPRCNLTLKQKCQIIELSGDLSTEQLAKKFRVHPTTVTRTVKNKDKILNQAKRVNVNFKTVQTNQRGEEHDTMILDYIKLRQASSEPITIKEICDKAVEYAKTLDRNIKSKRGWWRRFKVRCNIIRSKLQKAVPGPRIVHDDPPVEKVYKKRGRKPKNKDKVTGPQSERESPIKKPANKTSKNNKKRYTFRIRDNNVVHTTSSSNNTNTNNNNSTVVATTTAEQTPATDTTSTTTTTTTTTTITSPSNETTDTTTGITQPTASTTEATAPTTEITITETTNTNNNNTTITTTSEVVATDTNSVPNDLDMKPQLPDVYEAMA